MKRLILLVSALLLTLQFPVYAASGSRVVTVSKIHPIAAVRPAGGSNLIRVYVDAAPWGQTACRTDAADLQKDDKHLLASLFWAMSMNKQITIEVDDTLTPMDAVCQITAMFVE